MECFAGIVLEPCLLQPCFQVAGKCRQRVPRAARESAAYPFSTSK